ncbi:MAG: hypothetical protein M1456_00845 [Actinobacteria bacterium]|nr:hypothetical protein [Actinomycetota bacterium]MCL5885424.1 hypothetical protein [Actinomycetota bacterium]
MNLIFIVYVRIIAVMIGEYKQPAIQEKKSVATWSNRPPGVPSAVPPPAIPLAFLSASALGLAATGIALLWARHDGIPDPTTDPVVAVTHLCVLATLSVGIIGAIHQFIPVITSHSLRSTRLSWAALVVWISASWMLPIGIATQTEYVTVVSGILAACGLTIILSNVLPALTNAPSNASVNGLRLSLLGAMFTTLLGVTFVFDRQTNWFSISPHEDMAMGIAGLFAWLGLTYVAVSQKLWPMFFLAHVPGKHRSGGIAVISFFIGATMLASGIGFSLPWLAWPGAIILLVGIAAHYTSLVSHIKHRKRKTDLHLVYVVTSSIWLLFSILLALGTLVVTRYNHTQGEALAATVIVCAAGWLLTAIVGHVYKIVPFISWTILRSRGIIAGSNGKQIMFSDLYDHRFAATTYVTVTLGIASVATGYATSNATLIAVGGLCLLATAFITLVNLTTGTLHFLRYDK